MVTNSGGGYLRWLDLDITRWRADTTCDMPGAVCYIRDLESGTIWSTTNQPVRPSRVALHLDFHAGQSGVPADERAMRYLYRDRGLRRRRR